MHVLFLLQIDIFNPLTSLQLERCPAMPVSVYNAQAVWLNNKLYVGGQLNLEQRLKTRGSNPLKPGLAADSPTTSLSTDSTLPSTKEAARLYIYEPMTTNSWTVSDVPVYNFALATYDFKLVLVGGEMYSTQREGLVTNSVWTLDVDLLKPYSNIQPMKIKRSCATAIEYNGHIIVAGGFNNESMESCLVEVYNGYHWTLTQDLPIPHYNMKYTIFDGHLYLMGGELQGKKVYCAPLDDLVNSKAIWKTFEDVPHVYSTPLVFGNRLIAIGGKLYTKKSHIYAYSPYVRSWVHLYTLECQLVKTCSVALSKTELMLIGGLKDEYNGSRDVFRSILKGK